MKGKHQVFAVAIAGLVAFLLVSQCKEPPAAPVAPPPSPATKAVARAKTRVVIERPVQPAASASPAIERIVIENDAESEARVDPTTPPVLHTPLPVMTSEGPRHTRIGVVAGTFPGVLALDVQLIRGYPLGFLANWSVLPHEVRTLELSLDAEFNGQQAGLSLSAGDKVFASLGYFGSWSELSHGPFIGIGMRF